MRLILKKVCPECNERWAFGYTPWQLLASRRIVEHGIIMVNIDFAMHHALCVGDRVMGNLTKENSNG